LQRANSAEEPGAQLAFDTGKNGGTTKNQIWSGIRESNPRLDLGKVAYYHYTNPAHGKMCDVFIYSMGIGPGQDPGSRRFGADLPC
jgi:hypothetical protein